MMNAFSLKLLSYMIDNHPDRIEDTKFIEERGKLALHVFAQASRDGHTVSEALSMADETLYKDLHFSPYLMVKGIVSELSKKENTDEEDTGILIMMMLATARPVLQEYLQQQSPDSFVNSPVYDQAYHEIKRTIQQYFEEHGI